MQGTVPTPNGTIDVFCSTKEIKIKGGEGIGTLRFKSKKTPKTSSGSIKKLGNDQYELTIEKGIDYVVRYEPR